MNVITLSAVRFTKDLELKRSSNNTAILNFSVADNMKVNGEDKTIYLQCSAFGKQAEYLAQYGMKGGRVTVIGSLQPNNYTNKDGQRVEGMQIHVDRVELIDFKPKADNQAPSQQMQPQMNMNQGMPQMSQMSQMGQQPMNQGMSILYIMKMPVELNTFWNSLYKKSAVWRFFFYSLFSAIIKIATKIKWRKQEEKYNVYFIKR